MAGDNRTPDKTIGQVKYADGQEIAGDQRGQDQSADKKRAQESQEEGPAAYAPQKDEPTKPKKTGAGQ
jgi:hypothetical protein